MEKLHNEKESKEAEINQFYSGYGLAVKLKENKFTKIINDK